MKMSEEYRQDANNIIVSGIYFAVGVLILLSVSLMKGIVILIVGSSILLCLIVVTFTITYWSSKKSQQELEGNEAQEEKERQKLSTSK